MIKKDYEMKEENINNKLLILSNFYKNLNIIQKNLSSLLNNKKIIYKIY